MRETYLDNNGIERYEDNCKIVIKKTYTKEDNERANEIYNTFKTSNTICAGCGIDYMKEDCNCHEQCHGNCRECGRC